MSITEHQKKWQSEWRKTPKGLLTNIYSNQRRQFLRKDRRNGFHNVNYSCRDLHNMFLKDKKFIRIYKNWVDSGYKQYLKPSIDRKDCFKEYSLENIQIVTWEENKQKSYTEVPLKNWKKVIMYSMSGIKVREFKSVTQAKEIMGFKGNHISTVCRNKLKSYKGYIWKYKQ